MRIALNELGGTQWTGGITYRNNLIRALEVFDPEFKLYFISKEQKPDKELSNLIPVRLKPESKLDGILSKVYRKFLHRDRSLGRSIKSLDIQVVFPHSLKVGAKTRSIYWIPDFQFVHLPHLYSKAQLAQFQINLRRYFHDADLVIVSSQDAYNDFKEFSPEYLNKVRIMRFVAHVPSLVYEGNPADVAQIYHLPDDFIYMPNQFWAHKNHTLVLEALKLLNEQGIKVMVVCTGNPVDVRNPVFLAELIQKISEYGLRDQFVMLGLLPHQHVYWLMRQAKCVLNPSLFEGWSTSVEESKSVGKRMILSDLNVHKEQNPANSLFFDRNNANDLAGKLAEVWKNVPAGPDLEMEAEAQNALEDRMCEFAKTFLNICQEATQRS